MPTKFALELDVREAELVLEGITILLRAFANLPDGGSREPGPRSEGARPDDEHERPRLYAVVA